MISPVYATSENCISSNNNDSEETSHLMCDQQQQRTKLHLRLSKTTWFLGGFVVAAQATLNNFPNRIKSSFNRIYWNFRWFLFCLPHIQSRRLAQPFFVLGWCCHNKSRWKNANKLASSCTSESNFWTVIYHRMCYQLAFTNDMRNRWNLVKCRRIMGDWWQRRWRWRRRLLLLLLLVAWRQWHNSACHI